MQIAMWKWAAILQLLSTWTAFECSFGNLCPLPVPTAWVTGARSMAVINPALGFVYGGDPSN